jgi:hypothetical protein
VPFKGFIRTVTFKRSLLFFGLSLAELHASLSGNFFGVVARFLLAKSAKIDDIVRHG